MDRGDGRGFLHEKVELCYPQGLYRGRGWMAGGRQEGASIVPVLQLGDKEIEYSIVHGTSRRYTYFRFKPDKTS